MRGGSLALREVEGGLGSLFVPIVGFAWSDLFPFSSGKRGNKS